MGGENRNAWSQILIGVGWIALAVLFMFSRASLTLPGWIPSWVLVIAYSTFVVVLLLSWLLPLASGTRLLIKTHRKSK
jgi:hypothetical protein